MEGKGKERERKKQKVTSRCIRTLCHAIPVFAIPVINEYLRGRKQSLYLCFPVFTLVTLPVYTMTLGMIRFVFINPTDYYFDFVV